MEGKKKEEQIVGIRKKEETNNKQTNKLLEIRKKEKIERKSNNSKKINQETKQEIQYKPKNIDK